MIQSLNLFLEPVEQQLARRSAGGGSRIQDIPAEPVALRPAARIVFQSDSTSPAADRIRYLRMRLREPWETGKLKTLLITSPLAHDGKSTIALNLATALAEGGERSVLLVEADLHHAPLTGGLGLPMRPEGLAGCLENGADPIAAVRRLDLGWYLLPAGKASVNPTELLHGKALSAVMQKLIPHFDWILIDSPPVLPLTDALSLRPQADATLMVARAGSTPKDAIEEAVNLIGRQHVLGIVLNGIKGLNRLYYKYGYYRDNRDNSERS